MGGGAEPCRAAESAQVCRSQASTRAGKPREGPRPHQPARRPTEHWALPAKPLLSGQRARRRPSRVTGGCDLRSLGTGSRRGSPNAGGAWSSARDVRSAPLPRPPHPPGPARALPGFSPASAEEAAAVSVRTLGSLCERPRDPRQLLPSSDAAMARAQGQVGGSRVESEHPRRPRSLPRGPEGASF